MYVYTTTAPNSSTFVCKKYFKGYEREETFAEVNFYQITASMAYRNISN